MGEGEEQPHARSISEREREGGVQIGRDARAGSLFFRALVLEGHALLCIVQTVIDPSQVLRRGHPSLCLVLRRLDEVVIGRFLVQRVEIQPLKETADDCLGPFNRQREGRCDEPYEADSRAACV